MDEMPPVQERALKKLRKMMFAANRCHWFSAAELATFILTKGHCLVTHLDIPVFTGKMHFMFQECKRYYNSAVNEEHMPCTRKAVGVGMLFVQNASGMKDEAVEEPEPAHNDAA